MKDPIRECLRRRQVVFNAWLSLGSAYAAELIANAGWEALTVDHQHGMGGEGELSSILTIIRAAGAAGFVRVAGNDWGSVGRALDAGAQGIICPMIHTQAEAQNLVRSVKYPPLGERSYGQHRTKLLANDGDYFQQSNAWTVACALIETTDSLDNLDAILQTPGIDMVYAGPNDLAISLSRGRHHDVNAPEVREALAMILARCSETGVIAGAFANTAEQAKGMVEEGWQVLSVGTEAGWLAAAARATLESVVLSH
jgi:4-hydroxy-2-oxoheptanedioate aldolase